MWFLHYNKFGYVADKRGVTLMQKMTNISDDAIVKWLKLSLIKNGLGPARIVKLLNIFSDLDAIFNATHNELLQTGIMTEKMLENFYKLKVASDKNFYELI